MVDQMHDIEQRPPASALEVGKEQTTERCGETPVGESKEDHPSKDATVDTRADHLKAYRWQPGKSGNPAGRPAGARNQLSEAFLNALKDDFAEHGKASIEKARENDNTAYLKIIASLIPKELTLNLGFGEQLAAFLDGMVDITPPPITLDAESFEDLADDEPNSNGRENGAAV